MRKSISTNEFRNRPDIYSIVNQRIFDAMDKGIIPWKRPWSGVAPANYHTDKEYRGVNILTLVISAMEKGYKSPYWITYNQAVNHGGHVRRGEKSTPIVFSEKRLKEVQKDDGTKEVKVRRFLKYYNVFNLEQCEGLPAKEFPKLQIENDDLLKACDDLLAKMPEPHPCHEDGRHRAYYRPSTDTIGMPPLESFHSIDGFIATKFHEYGHATGHSSRLNRPGIMEVAMFGSEDYSFEELVAELTSAYLCARLGVDNSDTVENAVAYLQNWLQVLKNNKTMLLKASGKAMAAADYIIGTLSIQEAI
jgi:antirestriction protein ArdC